jgi:hypothetical protein
MNEVCINGVFGIAGVIIGAILSGVFTMISMSYGKINISIKNPYYSSNNEICEISFDIEVFNGKRDRIGFNNCMVVANYDAKKKTEFIPLYASDNREFKDLSTIEGKSFIKTSYKGSGLKGSSNLKYYFEYIVNGRIKF